MNHLKSLKTTGNYWNCFKYSIFVSKILNNFFRLYIRMENSNYKNKNIETKDLKTWCVWLIICISDPIKNCMRF